MSSASIPPEQSTNSLDPDKPFQCSRCVKSFKTAAGRGTHGRFCKGELPAATPSSQSWLTASGISPKEVKPFRKKLLHWLLVRKNAELKRGVSFWKKLKFFQGPNDLGLKHRLKQAAGTICSCLKGDHTNCKQYSFVCSDSKDPFLYLLPHKRNWPCIPDTIQKIIAESVWSVFQSEKLDRLINRGALRTTSCVESYHRTIRAPCPKGKPMRRNQTSVLKFGATIAAGNAKGRATVDHLRSLGLPVSSVFGQKMARLDGQRARHTQHRKTPAFREKMSAGRRRKYESHAKSLESKEATLYKKEGFADHSYAKTPIPATGESNSQLLGQKRIPMVHSVAHGNIGIAPLNSQIHRWWRSFLRKTTQSKWRKSNDTNHAICVLKAATLFVTIYSFIVNTQIL